jgi:hypothetical protein
MDGMLVEAKISTRKRSLQQTSRRTLKNLLALYAAFPYDNAFNERSARFSPPDRARKKPS